MRLTLFGAGNIGRSFIAPVFAAGGYNVTFVDINETVVNELNRRHQYQVVLLAPDGSRTETSVTGVDAILASGKTDVAEAVARADLAATAVGLAGYEPVCQLIAAGLQRREEKRPNEPLDIILAENIPDAAVLARRIIGEALPSRPAGTVVLRYGLVETSIGKMVPIMPATIAQEDPLVVYAEPYNTLIVDRDGFTGPIPTVQDVMAVENIRSYVDRKLFVHNLGHAAAAYLGFALDPSVRTIAEAVSIPPILAGARAAMLQSVRGLCDEYPDVFQSSALEDHVSDLLLRFANPSLGDTLFRVGRDLRRKLGHDDRIVGAMTLLARHNLHMDAVAQVYSAALGFAARDEQGEVFPADAECQNLLAEAGLGKFLATVSGLRSGVETDRSVTAAIKAAVAADHLNKGV